MADVKNFLIPINLNGNELQNVSLQSLTTAPANARDSMLYYNSRDNKFCFRENGEWVEYATLTDLENIDALPDQTGQSGKFLKTDGTDAFWSGLPDASDTVKGVVKVGTGLEIGTSSSALDLKIASANSLGGIKVGNNLSIDANGVLSAISSQSAVQSVNGETGAVVIKAVRNEADNTEMIKVWLGTKAEYDLLASKDPSTIYYVRTANTAVDLYALLNAKQNKLNQGTNITLTEQQDGTVTIAATAPVTSVAGKTGVVTLDKGDVGLSNVNNTSDADKPISTATQTALNSKADAATTLAGYGITDAYTKTEVDSKISSVYKPAGTVAFANLPTLSDSVLGNVYNLSDAFTTDARFVEGAGKNYPAGTNVVVVNTAASGETAVYKFDVLPGFIDLSGYLTTTVAAQTYATKTELTTLENKTVQQLVSENPVLTPTNGRATWTIAHTFGSHVHVVVKDESGDEVEPGVTQANNQVTISINTSSNIPAATYTAIIQGVVQSVVNNNPSSPSELDPEPIDGD